MSQVEQLIKKALSTTSDDEAIACLKQARKRYKGETVDVEVDPQRESNYEQLARKYHGIAYRNQQNIKLLQQELQWMNDTVIRWMNMHDDVRRRANKAESDLRSQRDANTMQKFIIAGLVPLALLFLIL